MMRLCDDCTDWVANGTTSSPHYAIMRATLGDKLGQVVLGEVLGFRLPLCDGCGAHGGNRHSAECIPAPADLFNA